MRGLRDRLGYKAGVLIGLLVPRDDGFSRGSAEIDQWWEALGRETCMNLDRKIMGEVNDGPVSD